MRNLVLVLGDQLDPDSAALDGFDVHRDVIWMAEVAGESTHVWSSKARIAVFLSAMRHYRDEQRAAGRTVLYRELESASPGGPSPAPEGVPGSTPSRAPEGVPGSTRMGEATTLAEALALDVVAYRPERLVIVQPGEWRVQESLREVAAASGVTVEIRPDAHFLCTLEEFAAHAAGRHQLRMEHFYRWMRRRTGVLMDGAQPVGGAWNFDAGNRAPFPRSGPGLLPEPVGFAPDDRTNQVLALVRGRFAAHPGGLDAFDWPVTRAQAQAALSDFIDNRLAGFGRYQDAIWAGEPWLYHSRISAALNLKLLDPREVISDVEAACREGRAPLASAEGFIRQVLGWREYVRGVYWTQMPGYAEANALGASRPLPTWYWSGDTPMACLRDSIGQTLRLGYAHHIQRLMVTGLFAQLLGVHPRAVHEWYLAVYVDAVEWVELPNVLGMSQYADGGLMASKPYVATGRYIDRMSNACQACPFDPAQRVGPGACPFTTLYWDFLLRHEDVLAANPRMALQVRKARALAPDEAAAIRARAEEVRAEHG